MCGHTTLHIYNFTLKIVNRPNVNIPWYSDPSSLELSPRIMLKGMACARPRPGTESKNNNLLTMIAETVNVSEVE